MDKSKSSTEELPKLTYAYGEYVKDGSTYIVALEGGELFADVTVNLSSYGVKLKANQVVIPIYKFAKGDQKTIKHDLVKKVIKTIPYGPFDAMGELVELKDDWKKKAIPLESLYSQEAT